MNIYDMLEEARVAIKSGFTAQADDIIVKALSELGKKDHAKALAMPTEGKRIVLDAVVSDLSERSEFGVKKYGTPLMTFNGRNSLVDALQEAYDLSMYLKQALMEYGDIQRMALASLWKPMQELPSREGVYPVAVKNKDVFVGVFLIQWSGARDWDLSNLSKGECFLAWFDMPEVGGIHGQE